MAYRKFWFIAKPHSLKEFYVMTYDDDKNAVIWTENRQDALKFDSLSSTRNYIKTTLKQRTDIFVVHAYM